LIFCYKIEFGLVHVKFECFFVASPSPQTKGHAYKLYKARYCNTTHRNFFAERVVNVEFFYYVQLTFRFLLVFDGQSKVLILLIFLNVVLISLFALLNFTLCCSGQLLVCNIAPCCIACLNCLFYSFFCVLSN